MNRSDEAAVIAELYPSLRRFAGAVGQADVEPDDLVQEALLKTIAAAPLSSFDNPGAYVRRVIVNLASNRRRGLGRGRRAVARLVAVEPVAPAYPSDLAELLRLPPDDRAALFLAHVERLPYSEVAAILGCTEEAARARTARARKRLRNELQGADQ